MTTLAGLQVSEAELSLVYEVGDRKLGLSDLHLGNQ